MPLLSEAQRRWMHANKPEMAKRWEKKTEGDLPEKVGQMTGKAFGHMFATATPDQREMLGTALRVCVQRHKADMVQHGFTAKSVDTVAEMLDQPLRKAGPLPQLEDLSKGCGCDHEDKMLGKCTHGLPMHGKADEMLDEIPWEVKQLISQLPLEIQSTELGGAGSTDIRPAMDQMNYENPGRNAGDCAGCDHVRAAPGVLMCSALAGDPAVGPNARCDLWGGSIHKSQQHLITLRKAKGGPFIGPRGGKWADAKHTVPWKSDGTAETWDSPHGRRKIVGTTTHGGKAVHLVTTGDNPHAQIISVDEIASEIEMDTKRHASRQKASSGKDAEAKARAKRISWHGFTDSMTPHRRAKAHAALDKKVQHKGEFTSRGDLVAGLVKEGWKIGSFKKFGEVLESPSGSFLAKDALTKTGLDLAKYLLSNLKKSGGKSLSKAEGAVNAQAKDGHARSYQEQTMPDYQYVYGNDDKLQTKREREASIRRRISLSFKHTAKYGFHGTPPEPTLKWEKDETVQWAPRDVTKVATNKPIVVAPKIDTRGAPLRSRSFLAPRITMAGKQAAPDNGDAQNGRAMEELMFFVDKADAVAYCGPRGLKAVPVDESLAKLHGVMVGGYIVEHPDTRMFLVAS